MRLQILKFALMILLAPALFLNAVHVFAINETLENVLQTDPGLVNLINDGTELDISTSIDGITVNFQWGYADRERIVLGYVLSVDPDQEYSHLQLVDVKLTSENAEDIIFDNSGLIPIGETEIASVLIANVNSVDNELVKEIKLSIAYANVGQDLSTITQLPTTETISFDIQLPIHAGGGEIDLNQVRQDENIELTLNKFSVAPSQASFVICINDLNNLGDIRWSWDVFEATLSYEDVTLESVTSSAVDECNKIVFRANMPLESQDWTLTIGSIRGVNTDFPSGPQLRATVEAAGGTYYEDSDRMSAFILPDGAYEDLQLLQNLEGEWVFSFTF